MNTRITLALLSALVLVNASAQEHQASAETTQPQAETARQQRDHKLRDEERAKALLEKKPVVYGGFLVDVSRAERKTRFFSLRQPRDPKNDTRNIAFEERTGRPRGFVLFRAEF